MVVSRWTNRLLIQLKEHTDDIPENLAEPWPLEVAPVESIGVLGVVLIVNQESDPAEEEEDRQDHRNKLGCVVVVLNLRPVLVDDDLHDLQPKDGIGNTVQHRHRCNG